MKENITLNPTNMRFSYMDNWEDLHLFGTFHIKEEEIIDKFYKHSRGYSSNYEIHELQITIYNNDSGKTFVKETFRTNHGNILSLDSNGCPMSLSYAVNLFKNIIHYCNEYTFSIQLPKSNLIYHLRENNITYTMSNRNALVPKTGIYTPPYSKTDNPRGFDNLPENIIWSLVYTKPVDRTGTLTFTGVNIGYEIKVENMTKLEINNLLMGVFYIPWLA